MIFKATNVKIKKAANVAPANSAGKNIPKAIPTNANFGGQQVQPPAGGPVSSAPKAAVKEPIAKARPGIAQSQGANQAESSAADQLNQGDPKSPPGVPDQVGPGKQKAPNQGAVPRAKKPIKSIAELRTIAMKMKGKPKLAGGY